eukprot:CAMPEP_0203639098 /NCGR_PEP_ID=MMETSP0088-20131115/4939_1 /ASSEMBLY_ACC=CAM_ASM_001087 /TAXON_ID=426623 /ORGANISM="Chaetoceros affinis, Strain CCMP159" /LENGTH=235 /DNA_ID=CAMNT_0050493897 /DNA_START=31 /DNA_END=739 /DNA_ORIENTATION=+
MGQAMRMMSYSQSKNMSATTSIPGLVINNAPLSFYRMDDGVMGGQSQTHKINYYKIKKQITTCDEGNSSDDRIKDSSAGEDQDKANVLAFSGIINTNGGGFASIRSPLDNSIPNSAKGLKIKYKGDGKTYKILLSDGKGGGPFSSSPSWQIDLPTKDSSEEEEACVYFNDFVPSFGGRASLSQVEREKYSFVNEEMKQIGLMLSLKLSNGDPNPVETFGSGIFDFRLEVDDVQLV